ncbi:inositol monophosphatase [Halovivax asiaticus JCM 14624]|uniref:NAD kinase n=1 Tax=Halovivax asiaticus JCM 14624 TaxID=1227490 RepID=M0BW14_9EURY|nr:inositol monophosphatase family protein [Halovivax asiaticus]ELZ14302.1 inositol monophosphatase [Halovivax asiaticus JCM 14624]
MQGRRLATTDEVVAIVSPDAGDALARLEAWCTDRGLGLSTVDVGDDIGTVYDENRATLGVTLGGDGTFLEGIKTFAPRNVPMLGIDLGTLSFLARVDPSDMEAALDEAIRGRARVDSRQQLAIDAPGIDTTGINDVMVEHVPPESPIGRKVTTLDVTIDDEYVGEFEGTGLAVSTPTGSTGVSLSANGPLHYPANNYALQLIPLQTHALGVRPIVCSPTSEIHVRPDGETSLTVDGGRVHTVLDPTDDVLITGADTRAHIVRTSYGYGFFTAITKKLGWSIREDDAEPPTGFEALTEARPESMIERARRIAVEAAHSAAEPLRELHGRVEDVTYKSDKSDLVTEADHQADRIITTVIANEFPSHAIVSEESEGRIAGGERASTRTAGGPAVPDEAVTTDELPYDNDAETGDDATTYTWVVDPLDGTGNFAHGNPNYAVSIALVADAEPILGVVHVPETDETFSAVAGEGAYVDGTPLGTTDRTRLDESMLLSGYDPDGSFLTQFYQQARGVRRLGCAALHLCYLASGSTDAIWEYDTYPWDVAAGIVIAREAGATITDDAGDPYPFELERNGRTPLLGSNGPLHERLLDHLGETTAVDD